VADSPSAEVELISDPGFAAGVAAIEACEDPNNDPTCAHSPRYDLLPPARSATKPRWELAQWGSSSNLDVGRPVEGGYAWETPHKRLVIFHDGTVELAVNGEDEFESRYPAKRLGIPELILAQEINSRAGSVDRMTSLIFNLDFRKVYDQPNRRRGYDPAKHALIFPVNFTVQNKNPASPGFGEYIWLQIVPYDDRRQDYKTEAERTQIDVGTRRLIYFIPLPALTDQQPNTGRWVTLRGDILPFAYRALDVAFSRDLLKSRVYRDYSLGSVNIGYELTGLNVATFQFKNLSLKAKRR
jgi:hypothetical protein